MNSSEYLLNEIVRLQKKSRTAIVAGVISSLIIAAYAVMGSFFLNVFSKPEDLAAFAMAKFAKQAPHVLKDVEANLIKQAPTTAENLSKTVQQSIPTLRFRAQEAISHLIDDRFKTMQTQMIKLTDAFFAAHTKEIPLRGKTETVEDYGKRVANALADNLGEELNKSIKHSIGKDIYDLNLSSKHILSLSQKHFDKLAATPYEKLNEDDKLERLLIAHLLNKYFTSFEK